MLPSLGFPDSPSFDSSPSFGSSPFCAGSSSPSGDWVGSPVSGESSSFIASSTLPARWAICFCSPLIACRSAPFSVRARVVRCNRSTNFSSLIILPTRSFSSRSRCGRSSLSSSVNKRSSPSFADPWLSIAFLNWALRIAWLAVLNLSSTNISRLCFAARRSNAARSAFSSASISAKRNSSSSSLRYRSATLCCSSASVAPAAGAFPWSAWPKAGSGRKPQPESIARKTTVNL